MASVWRRRRRGQDSPRPIDSPRPAGRRWARLRRSGSRATAVFARVARRRGDSSSAAFTAGEQVVFPRPDRAWRRIGARRSGVASETFADSFGVRGVATGDEVKTEVGDGQTAPVTIPLLPGERTAGRRVKFAVANGATVASLTLGMSAAFLAMRGSLTLAALALLGCVVLDGLDGALARRFAVASPFGAQMDSLADLAAFGVGTGLVVYQWLVVGGAAGVPAAAASILVAVCAAIRLARFNVSPKDGRYFCGVPTTMAAAVLALNTLVGPTLPSGFQLATVVVCAVAMVTSFPYAKLARIARLPLWLWVLPAICAMISIPATFAGIVSVYLVSGPVLWVYFRRGRVRPRLP